MTMPSTQLLPALPLGEEECWQAIARRDRTADGRFYYGVVTTGVFCRPSCGSRPALRENVRFFATAGQARAAGFRSCKRCKPEEGGLNQRYAELVASACRLIEIAEQLPSLETLAQAAGLSRFHFHRVFKSVTGVTPKAYASQNRAQRLREQLGRGDAVVEAIYGAGYNSGGPFYASSTQMLGMKPSDYRAGGSNATIRFAVGNCSLGAILVAATDKGVCAILLGDDAEILIRDLQDRFAKAELIGGDSAFERLVAQVVGAVEAPDTGFDLPLDVRGTAFQQRVWKALCDIPVGQTASYSEIAERIGAPASARAVAQACGANSIAVAIPCHRVVRNDGALSGYRWGVERKRRLLEREAASVSDC